VRVAVLDDYQDAARRFGPWDRLAAEVTVFHDHVAGDDALIERLAPFDVVVAMRERTPFPRKRLERLPNLGLLVTTGMANASIDLAAAREHGVVVAGTGGVAASTAELAWGLILALARNIPREDANLRTGGWQHTIGPELAGRTLGVVGLGRLGTRVARIGQAFEMRTIAWSQHLDPEHARTHDVEPVSKQELFRRADVVTIHLRLSDRTRGLVGAQELDLMRTTAYVINTSRGPIVDEDSLVEALHTRRIAGAALDVFDTEPLPEDHPLRTAPNTVLTPHLGYVTTGSYEIYYREAVEDIEAWLNNQPLRVLT
jgi:phosphoglycerate dehydrogenase-like enzyme